MTEQSVTHLHRREPCRTSATSSPEGSGSASPPGSCGPFLAANLARLRSICAVAGCTMRSSLFASFSCNAASGPLTFRIVLGWVIPTFGGGGVVRCCTGVTVRLSGGPKAVSFWWVTCVTPGTENPRVAGSIPAPGTGCS